MCCVYRRWISYPAYVAFPLHLSVGIVGLVLLLLSSTGNSRSSAANLPPISAPSNSATSSSVLTTATVEPFRVDWQAARATIGAEFKAIFAALGASLVCGLLLACFGECSYWYCSVVSHIPTHMREVWLWCMCACASSKRVFLICSANGYMHYRHPHQ